MKILIKNFIFIFFSLKYHLLYCPNSGTNLTLIFVDPIYPLGKSSTILLIVIRVNMHCIHSRLSTSRLITKYDTTFSCVVILCGVLRDMEKSIQYDLMLSRFFRYCMKTPTWNDLVLSANFVQLVKDRREHSWFLDDTRLYWKLTNVDIILG